MNQDHLVDLIMGQTGNPGGIPQSVPPVKNDLGTILTELLGRQGIAKEDPIGYQKALQRRFAPGDPALQNWHFYPRGRDDFYPILKQVQWETNKPR